MSNYKTCSVCKTTQSLEQFRKNHKTPDGLTYPCKSCLNHNYKLYRKRVPKIASQKDKDRQKQLRLENPDLYRQKSAAYYQANKERHKIWHKNWLAAQPGRNANYVRQYNIRKKGNEVFLVTNKELRKLRSKPCYYCDSKTAGTVDHVIPIKKSGRHSIGNLVPACLSCNARKNSKLLIVWRIEKGEFK